MTSPVAVRVRAIAAGGAGVADLPDGRVVFVPRTAPGDRATIRIEKSRPRWAEGSLCELLEPAEERRPALCALYDECGGCQLQHLPYARQLEWKGRAVADALTRIGRLEGVEAPEVVASPSETEYRSRVTFTLRRLRGGKVVAGFHALGRPAHVVDVSDECVLPHRRLLAAWLALRAGWGEGARLLPSGGRLRLTLRDGDEGTVLVVEGGPAGWRADALTAAVPGLGAVWHRPATADAALERAESPSDEAAAPAFQQVNPGAAELLVRHLSEVAGPGVGEDGPRHVVDAFCGDGVYGATLVALGWRVTGIESDPAACAAARARALEGLTVHEGPVEDLLAGALPADLVIVNPPRAGLPADVVGLLAERRPARVVYVSCNPATLARDVAGLSDAYEPRSLRCFDLFPQTAHVESVLELVARGW